MAAAKAAWRESNSQNKSQCMADQLMNAEAGFGIQKLLFYIPIWGADSTNLKDGEAVLLNLWTGLACAVVTAVLEQERRCCLHY